MDVNVASHISSNLPKYERSLISQLRLCILPIRIETGRYSNLPEQQRLCLLCDSNQVENEWHLLFHCNLYDVERSQFEHSLNISFGDLTDNNKFTTVFQHPFMLGRYLRQVIRKRRQKLYRWTLIVRNLLLLCMFVVQCSLLSNPLKTSLLPLHIHLYLEI